MIEDIIYDNIDFILETNTTIGGIPIAYSLDGDAYDFTSTSSSAIETSYVFVQ